jgi:hypothetical protein
VLLLHLFISQVYVDLEEERTDLVVWLKSGE